MPPLVRLPYYMWKQALCMVQQPPIQVGNRAIINSARSNADRPRPLQSLNHLLSREDRRQGESLWQWPGIGLRSWGEQAQHYCDAPA